MAHLYKYNLMQQLREKNAMFWTLLFPIIMGALFYVTFGTSAIEMMKNIPVAAVAGENQNFETFLEEMDSLEVQIMTDEEAKAALEKGKIKGIFYCDQEPSLTVAGTQIDESILEVLLKAYTENQQMMMEIGESNPLGLVAAIPAMNDYRDMVIHTSVSGNEVKDSLTYFFALIAMACMFGSLSGLLAASSLRADQSALAARQSVVPVHRMSAVVSQMLSCFTIQFANICILLLYLHFVLQISFGERWILLLPVCALGCMAGVAFGIFVGSQRLKEGIKIGILVGGTLFMSFLSGLMFGNMKDVVEHHIPILNRINPAALIADAFYSISIYENMARYRRNLLLLAAITAVLVFVSYKKLRRERYDSI